MVRATLFDTLDAVVALRGKSAIRECDFVKTETEDLAGIKNQIHLHLNREVDTVPSYNEIMDKFGNDWSKALKSAEHRYFHNGYYDNHLDGIDPKRDWLENHRTVAQNQNIHYLQEVEDGVCISFDTAEEWEAFRLKEKMADSHQREALEDFWDTEVFEKMVEARGMVRKRFLTARELADPFQGGWDELVKASQGPTRSLDPFKL